MKTLLLLMCFGQLLYLVFSNCNIDKLNGINNFEISKIASDQMKPTKWYVLKRLGSHGFPNFSDNLEGLIFYFQKTNSYTNFEVVLRGKNDQFKCLKLDGVGFLTNPNNAEGKITINYTSTEESFNGQTWTEEKNFWILDSDYNKYLFLYACNQRLPNDNRQCSSHVVFILSQQPYDIDNDYNVKEKINECLTKVCIKYENLQTVRRDFHPGCSPETERCDMDYLPIEKNLDFNELTGKWYAVRQLGNIIHITPKDSKYAILDFRMEQGNAYITFYFRSAEGKCIDPEEGKVDVYNAINGQYSMTIKIRKIDFVVLKEPSTQKFILFFCEQKRQNGSCEEDKLMKFVLDKSNSRFIEDHIFRDYVKENCLDPNGEFITNEFHLVKDCSNDAYIASYLNKWILVPLILALLFS